MRNIAGLLANVDNNLNTWDSPAGQNKGRITNVTSLVYNPPVQHRDILYGMGINPVINQTGVGVVLFGDKTAVSDSFATAFDRIGVRRLFIRIEQDISRFAQSFLFEQNTDIVRHNFESRVDRYLSSVSSAGGISEYKVESGTGNNPPDSIDAGNLIADVYIKPTRSVNFIQLNFIAVATGVEFSEVA